VTVTSVPRGPARWITIDNPDTRNALTVADRSDLSAALREADGDPDAAVIVLTGEGGQFCSGGDIREFDRERTTLEASRYASEIAQPVFVALRESHTPTIARVKGVAAGAGMYLALGCDIVIAESTARFVPAHLELAAPPDWGALWLMPRLIGVARAKKYLLTSQPIGAGQAADWGLIAEAVPAADLDHTVQTYCERIARFDPSVVSITRRGLDRSLDQSLSSFLEWEALAIAATLQRPEHRNQVKAFLRQRSEEFT
jgi:enoyl-CoA hydratase/carnithine racemase